MYEKLVSQYSKLPMDGQSALLIYKSHLSYAINNIHRIDDMSVLKEIREIYEIYKEMIENTSNMFIKVMFNKIRFDNFQTFLSDISKVEKIINSLKGRMVLDENTTLYRGVSFEAGKDIYGIANDNLISTSMSKGVASSFHLGNPYQNVLYEMSVEKGTPCLVIPYSIKQIDDYTLKLENGDSQKEILLFRDSMDILLNKNDPEYVKVMTKMKKRH